jgi:hypothetical protein
VFAGKVYVGGKLTKAGGGFKIDHPLEPTRRYLNHAFVESADMKNLYDGIASLDKKGEAVVELPKWFQALNKEIRYQLTPIGRPAPDLHIAQPLVRNRFRIAGGRPGMKVSWQVTGTRQDALAKANRIAVEEEKEERGFYLHPELFGKSALKRMDLRKPPQPTRKAQEAMRDAREALAKRYPRPPVVPLEPVSGTRKKLK